ncbi:ABC transporter substrate-binding protein [Terrabacter sp. NPDC000476]|uniref:ABC transporter substrate-binding protein n=1 Tax=Terrabacter sp. NPDC000476 TaxID=3154258 RepID=UPI0033289628
MTTTRTRRRTVAVAIAVALGLSACSTTSGPGGGGTGEQTLRYAPGLFPVSLDVQQYPAEEAVQTAAQQVLEPLVELKDGVPAPLLAEKWTNPDDRTWVFTLREGVTFSDGSPLEAADVVASVQRLIDLEGPLKPVLESVTSIEATDARTVTIRTSSPLGTLASTMSLVFVGPAERVGQDDFWKKPIGTGPFKVESFAPDDKVVMTRNDAYWGTKPALSRLEFVNYPEVSARLTALETGEVDVTNSIPPDQVAAVSDKDGLTYETKDGFTYYFIWFNQNRDQFKDAKVRQAMWHAVNVEETVADLYGDGATVAKSPVTQSVFGSTPLQPYAYDPARAKALLAEAGFPNGFSTSIQWPREGGPNIKALAQAMVSDWAKVGITVKPLEKERAQWLKDFGALSWDLNLQTNTTGTGDADFTLARLYTCAAKRMGYCNPELDKTLMAARASLDQSERKKLYAEADAILWKDAPGIFPADLKNNAAVRDSVKGFELPPNGRPTFKTVSVATGD